MNQQASTHTEIYRPYIGQAGVRSWRSLPLARAQIARAFRRKLPLILFAPPLMATVIFSFVVYSKFALEAGINPTPGVDNDARSPAALMGNMASNLIQVREQIVAFHLAMNLFVLLSVAWYGAGLIAEDRREKAHLLYFARPIRRSDYLLGKFLTVLPFGAVATLLPGVVICAVASFASPDWSFVKEEGDVIWKMLAFSLVSLLCFTSITLAISSLCQRKTHALAGTLGFFLLLDGIAALLWSLQRDRSWLVLSPFGSLRRIAAGLFDMPRTLGMRTDWSLSGSWAFILGLCALSLVVLWWRVRVMEREG
jgi:ABC-type transport system involved in multi-copper enzyme maturation permease subunit